MCLVVQQRKKVSLHSLSILFQAGGWGVGSRGGDGLVPVSGVRVAEASSDRDDLVVKTLDVGDRPGAQLGNGTFVSIVHQLHVVSTSRGSADSRGNNTTLDLGQSIIGQLVDRVIVVNIGISRCNIPGGNDISQILQRRLDLDIVGVSVTESTITKRGAHVTGGDSKDVEEGLLNACHFEGDLFDGEGGQLGVGPGVRSDLMAGFVGALDDGADGGVVDAAVVVAVNKEGDLDLLLVEEVEELMGVLLVFRRGTEDIRISIG